MILSVCIVVFVAIAMVVDVGAGAIIRYAMFQKTVLENC